MRKRTKTLSALAGALLLGAAAVAGPITVFTTGSPDGKIATLSRTPGTGLETETADDFIVSTGALITGATFVGLLPSGTPLSAINRVEIELYHIFPVDSGPPDGKVPTRTNSPSDHEFLAFDSSLGSLTFIASILNPSFSAANSVVNGINPVPNQTTGGEGPVTGEEVQFTVTFPTPFLVAGTDHDFFRPEVGLNTGNFLWLSAPRPLFTGDLQAWIRNASLAPDWLRIGTDIIGGTPAPTFNMTFSLVGNPLPEPGSILLVSAGLALLAWRRLSR